MKTIDTNPALAGEGRATLDDIVFEFRNKDYGAYDLRQSYPTALRNALVLGITIFLMLFILPTLYSKWRQGVDDQSFKEEIKVIDVNLDPKLKPLPEIPKASEPPPQKKIKYVTPEVTNDAPDNTEMPKVDEIEKATISNVTQEGTDETTIVTPPVDIAPSVVEKEIEVKSEAPLETYKVEIQPEFMGGMRALSEYLSKNLKYPSNAARSGVSGRVHLQFTVEPDGSLSNILVLKGIGFGCDEEATRVIKQMPNWKPGRQSGRAVRVKFTLPIVFALE